MCIDNLHTKRERGMKMIAPEGLREEMVSNKFFSKKHKEFIEAMDTNRTHEFLDDNPEFVQMMMNYADKITIEEDE